MSEINCRYSELPVVARFTINTFKRDKADIIAYSNFYADPYEANFRAKITNISGVIFPENLFPNLKAVTRRLYNNVDSLRDMVFSFEGYFKRSGIDMSAKDFGITELRKQIKRRDVEQLLISGKILSNNITTNMTALTAAGLKPADLTKIGNTFISIRDDNDKQNEIMDQIELLVKDNKALVQDLWDSLTDLLDAGKRVYKFSNPVKAKDYTFSNILKRIRNEWTKKEEEPPTK